jgi:hypothetical protein
MEAASFSETPVSAGLEWNLFRKLAILYSTNQL